MPFEITSASGKGRTFGMGDWGDDDLIVDVERPTPGASLVVNDWLWGGGPPVPVVIPWTWLQTPLELRTDTPINSVSVTRTGGTTALSNNATSQTTYGVFSASGSLDTHSPDDPGNLAAFITTYYGNPLLRAPMLSLSLTPRTTEERWRILGVEIGMRITLGPGTVQDYPGHTTVLPVPTGLPAGTQSLVVEGIHHTSSVDGRVVEWTTAPLLGSAPGTEGPWFRIDSSFLDGTDAVPF